MVNEKPIKIRTFIRIISEGFFMFLVIVLISVLHNIESYEIKLISGAVLGITALAVGLTFFKLSNGLNCLVIMLSPEHVTAHLDIYHVSSNNSGTKNLSGSWIEYHYSYRDAEYTGKGRALDFNELTSPNTSFTLCISRINPNFSYRGDPRVGLVWPLVFMAITVAFSIYFAFVFPKIAPRVFHSSKYVFNNERSRYSSITKGGYKFVVPNCSSGFHYFYKIFNEHSFQNVSKAQLNSKHKTPIEWESNRFDISAIGMTNMPKRFSLNQEMQSTTLYVENDSHAAIQVNGLRQNGTPVPQTPSNNISIPSGSRCDWPLYGPMPWQLMSGTTVLGVLTSTPQTGYVSIRDRQ